MLSHAVTNRVSTLCLSTSVLGGDILLSPVNVRRHIVGIQSSEGKLNSRAFLRSRTSAEVGRRLNAEQNLPTQRRLTAVFLQNFLCPKNDKSIGELSALACVAVMPLLGFPGEAQATEQMKLDSVYEVAELFELGIQLSYLLILLGLLGAGTFFVIRQVLVRRELDLSAKELQEQVRSGDASATEYFELGAVMLRRKFYPAAVKYLQQAIDKWDGDNQDLAQVYNALGVSYLREEKLEKGIAQFAKAVKLQPGYVTAWNNLGDAYEKNKDLEAALKAFEEALLLDPNNKVARPRRDALRDRVRLFQGVPLKSKPEERR